MPDSRKRIGIIGCGGRVRGLAKILRDSYPDQIAITALFDPLPASIEATREVLNPHATAYSDYRQLVADPSLDWVMIGSWNCFHREQAIAAFAAGKHVFCEKPLATTTADCLAMRDAWQTSGLKFNIGFTLRYSPHYRKIKELLSANAIGRIISLEFNETLGFCHGGYIMGDWRRLTANAGTHLLEKCCHDIDLVNWMLESKAARVASFGGLDIFCPENSGVVDAIGPDSEGRPAYQTWPGTVNLNPFTADKDILDNQVAIIEYENGARASFHTNCCSAIPERRMYICGTLGAIRANVITGQIEFCRIGFDEEIQHIDAGASGGHGGGDEVLVRSLADCILHDAEPFTSLDDGLKAAFTCFAIDEAERSGRIIAVDKYWQDAGLQ